MLTLNHGYQKLAGMVGVAYQTAMPGLEGGAKMTGGLVLLDGLYVARAKNEKIRDILTLRLVAMTVSKAPNYSWSCQHSIQMQEPLGIPQLSPQLFYFYSL